MNVFRFHKKVLKASNKVHFTAWLNLNKNKTQIYSYYKKIFRRKKCDTILLFSQSYFLAIEAQSCLINLVKWRDFPGENKENLSVFLLNPY